MEANDLHLNCREERKQKNSRLKEKSRKSSFFKKYFYLETRTGRVLPVSYSSNEFKIRFHWERLFIIILLILLGISFSGCSSKEVKSGESQVATKTYTYIDQDGEKNIIFSQTDPQGVILGNKFSLDENLRVLRANGENVTLSKPREFMEYEGFRRNYNVYAYTVKYNTLFDKVNIVNSEVITKSYFAWELIIGMFLLLIYGFFLQENCLDYQSNKISSFKYSCGYIFGSIFSIIFLIGIIVAGLSYAYGNDAFHIIMLMILLFYFLIFSFLSGLIFWTETYSRNFLCIISLFAMGIVFWMDSYQWIFVLVSFFLGILISQILYYFQQQRLKSMSPEDRELELERKN